MTTIRDRQVSTGNQTLRWASGGSVSARKAVVDQGASRTS